MRERCDLTETRDRITKNIRQRVFSIYKKIKKEISFKGVIKTWLSRSEVPVFFIRSTREFSHSQWINDKSKMQIVHCYAYERANTYLYAYTCMGMHVHRWICERTDITTPRYAKVLCDVPRVTSTDEENNACRRNDAFANERTRTPSTYRNNSKPVISFNGMIYKQHPCFLLYDNRLNYITRK